jgi:nicotinamidase-related amidase
VTRPAGFLAVIDMQRVFAEPGSPWRAPRFGEITGPVAKLAAAFRPHVVFTRFLAPDHPAGAWQRYYEAWPFARQPPDARIYELVDDVGAVAGQSLDAVTFSKWGPELAQRVAAAGGRLVLAGVSTDCCVLSTAVAAADAGAEVAVAADACAGATDESHQQALAILRLYAPLVEVVSVADILDE